MKDIFFRKQVLRRPSSLKRHYDVVIVGGGSHGLATAYYLAKHHGITDVAILEKSYIGAGAAGRNTTIIRVELPHARGRRLLQGERQALRDASPASSTSTSCSRSTGTSRSRTPTAPSSCRTSARR